MNTKLGWTVSGYFGVVLFVALANARVATNATKVSSLAMTGDEIPAAYLATLPDVMNNNGVVPTHVRNANVVPYVVESHRGWPLRIEDRYGYRYDLSNTATGYSATLIGYPTDGTTKLSYLVMNLAGTLVLAAILHMCVVALEHVVRNRSTASEQIAHEST